MGNADKEKKKSQQELENKWVKAGSEAAACEGPTWFAGVKAEGVAAGLSLREPSSKVDELLFWSKTRLRTRRTTPIAARAGRLCEKADTRVQVLHSAGDGSAIPGLTRRSNVVPGQRTERGSEKWVG